MNIDKIIKIERIKEEHTLFEKCTLLSLFHLGILINRENGQHLSFSIGIGPLETEISLRLWLKRENK